MAPDGAERRLAAILSADVVGYSRLMAEDENATNLAARLQSLTRDLDASLVIDHATWERAQPAAAGFEKRPDVPIRGRRETQDLYVLAMPAPS